MSTFRFFTTASDLLKVIHTLTDVVVLGRRFEGSGLPVGYHLVQPLTPDSFVAGRFSELVLSMGRLPSSPVDWGFLDRNEQSLLIIDGGHQSGDQLEAWRVRTLAKRSEAARVFRSLKRGVIELGGTYGYTDETGTDYPDVFVVNSAMGLRLLLSV